MLTKIAILGGVIPAAILGIALLAAGGATRARTPRPGSDASPPDRPATPPRTGWAWLLGAAIAIPFIHHASWSRPQAWPVDATYRLVHSVGVLLLWEAVLQVFPLAAWARLAGRVLAVGVAVGVLLHAYVGSLGWPTVVGATVAAVGLGHLHGWSISRAQVLRHPALIWGVEFAAALAASGVLFLGSSATGAQAAAGAGALAAATAVAALVFPRVVATSPGGWVIAGMLAWLLALGCFTPEPEIAANLGSAILILLTPLGWALPKRWLVVEAWRTRSLMAHVAVAWTVVCLAGAVVLALLTRSVAEDAGFG